MTTVQRRKHLSESLVNQIAVLKAMSTTTVPTDSRALHINEIAEMSGLKDEKEIQRYLFILEGQKLVVPQPEGDFTSRTWVITRDGMRVARKASSASPL